MKILIHSHVPFMLAHGGAQIQIEQTRMALEKIGLEAEFLRWYDDKQKGDVLHFFGRIPLVLLTLAHQKGIKVVQSELLTRTGSRTPAQLRKQKLAMRLVEKTVPRLGAELAWKSFQLADACVALTEWEAQLMHDIFGAPRDRLHVVPNGVEEVFLQSKPAARGPWLVTTVTITERKRVIEMAEAAAQAQTPLWVIGKAYSDTDPYAKKFFELAKKHSKFIRFEGEIQDRARMAEVYREARGFVLLSAMESLSLSALEAAACECPLLLSDLPWAKTTFKESATYCGISGTAQTAGALRKFYDAAPSLKSAAKPMTWVDVARELKKVYEFVLSKR